MRIPFFIFLIQCSWYCKHTYISGITYISSIIIPYGFVTKLSFKVIFIYIQITQWFFLCFGRSNNIIFLNSEHIYVWSCFGFIIWHLSSNLGGFKYIHLIDSASQYGVIFPLCYISKLNRPWKSQLKWHCSHISFLQLNHFSHINSARETNTLWLLWPNNKTSEYFYLKLCYICTFSVFSNNLWYTCR